MKIDRNTLNRARAVLAQEDVSKDASDEVKDEGMERLAFTATGDDSVFKWATEYAMERFWVDHFVHELQARQSFAAVQVVVGIALIEAIVIGVLAERERVGSAEVGE